MTAATEGVTVVLCCYNSADRVPETLRHLSEQRVPPGLPWEIVVVDNGSTDGTSDVVRERWSEWGRPAPLRVIQMPEPSVVAARNRGVEEARYEYVLFCDDDNWLASDYLAVAADVMSAHPEVGGLGGRGEPVLEAAPPEWLDRYQAYFALGPQGAARGDISDEKGYAYGAGLVVRRSAWRKVLADGFHSLVHEYRLKANDAELCYLLRLAGYRIFYEPALAFRHDLPASRLRWDRFLALVHDAHVGSVFVEPYRHVLDRPDAYVPPRRDRWLLEVARLSRRLARSVASLLLRSSSRSEGDSRDFNASRWRGKLLGWWWIRWNFRSECIRIAALAGRLRS